MRGWWWGWGEAGLVIAAPTPFPTQLLRYHLTFVARFAFLLLLYLRMCRCRKGLLFNNLFDSSGESEPVILYFSTTCREEIKIIRVLKVLFFYPGHIINFLSIYLSVHVFLYENDFMPLSYKRKNRSSEEIT